MEDELQKLARRLGEILSESGLCCVTAESCTGGWVAKVITDIEGSSHWFERGFVTYSNRSKRELLGVGEGVLERHGAVSEAVVRSMVQGALQRSPADLALSISGIAGPGGGTADKPVGTVWLAWGRRNGETRAEKRRFHGEREAVRRQAAAAALRGMIDLVE